VCIVLVFVTQVYYMAQFKTREVCTLAFWSCRIRSAAGTRAVLPKFVVVFPLHPNFGPPSEFPQFII
jgi:hypothetical protein